MMIEFIKSSSKDWIKFFITQIDFGGGEQQQQLMILTRGNNKSHCNDPLIDTS
jgi:hypothetical protein